MSKRIVYQCDRCNRSEAMSDMRAKEIRDGVTAMSAKEGCTCREPRYTTGQCTVHAAPDPAPAEIGPDERVLDRVAHAMMTVELSRQMSKTLEDALRMPSEVNRTYKRLIASSEAQMLLAELEKSGLEVAPPQPAPLEQELVWRHLVKRMYDECGSKKATDFIDRVQSGEHDVPSPWSQPAPQEDGELIYAMQTELNRALAVIRSPESFEIEVVRADIERVLRLSMKQSRELARLRETGGGE